MSGDFGCSDVVVDAYASAVSFYARYGFFALESLEGGSITRPETSEMCLALKTIKAALKPAPRVR